MSAIAVEHCEFLTVIIPHGNPGVHLVAGKKIQVRAVSRKTLTVVIQSIDLTVGQRNTSNGLTPAVFTICILVDVVSQVNNIVDRIFPDRVSKGIEETEWEVATGVDCEIDTTDIVGWRGRSLGAANGALHVRIADVELVKIRGEGFQVCSLDLDGVVNVTAGVHSALIDNICDIGIGRDLELDTDWSIGWRLATVGVVVDGDFWVIGHKAGDGIIVLHVVELRRATGPDDHAVGEWIAGGHAMGEIEAGRGKRRTRIVSFDDFPQVDSQTRVVMGGRAVVQVLAIGGDGRGHQGGEDEELQHSGLEGMERSARARASLTLRHSLLLMPEQLRSRASWVTLRRAGQSC